MTGPMDHPPGRTPADVIAFDIANRNGRVRADGADYSRATAAISALTAGGYLIVPAVEYERQTGAEFGVTTLLKIIGDPDQLEADFVEWARQLPPDLNGDAMLVPVQRIAETARIVAEAIK